LPGTASNKAKKAKVVAMKCRQAQSRLSGYSAEHLSDKELAALCEHLEQCPECHREWVVLQSTLLTLSTSSQPLLSREASDKMWQCCEDRIKQQIAHGEAAFRKVPLAQRDAYEVNLSSPSVWGWVLQPQVGWATLGAAVAIFGTVWMMTPAPTTEQPLNFAANTNTSAGPVTQVAYERPPADSMPLLNHHAAMSIDPFTDHVGATLVSYSPQR